MPYFRVSYEGYTEGEFPSDQDAVNAFIEAVKDDISSNLRVEEFDEELREWVVV